MQVFSHRGYHVELPENTLAAFAAAAGFEVDGIETDLRLSADGQVVLHHDRLAPDGRPIAQVTRAELSRLCGHPVATADEALDHLPQLIWNLELKCPEVLPAALELVDRYRTSHRLLITSFWHDLVEQVARRYPVECGFLVCHAPHLPPQSGLPFSLGSTPIAEKIGPQTISPLRLGSLRTVVWCYEFLDASVVAHCRALGYRNLVYGLATPEEHRQCAAWGVDGQITDRPEFALPGK